MKEQAYVLVSDEHDFRILKKQIKAKNFEAGSIVAVLWQHSMEPFFKDNGIKYLLLSDYAKDVDFDAHRQKLLELIETFPHKKILDDKSLVELLKYSDCSLWWLLRQGFLENFMSVIRIVYPIRQLARQNKIKNIILLSNDDEFISAVKESVKSTNINVSMSKNDKFDLISSLESYKCIFYAYLPRIVRTFQGFFRSFRIKNKDGKKNILLFTQDWTDIGNGLKGDPNSYTILRNILQSKAYNVLPLDVVGDIHVQWKSIKEKKFPFIPYDYFISKSYFDSRIRKNIKSLRNRLSILWKKLENNEDIRKILAYDGLDLFYALKPRVKSYFFNEYDSFIGAARNIEIGMRLIEDYHIDATICIDENGHSRFLVFASRLRNIRSIGVQHGIIYRHHPSYNYSRADLFKYKNKIDCILPDKTAVFGNHFKNLLLKCGNYRPEQIEITGQPRTDIYIENEKKYSRKRLCKSLRIDPNKKIIVFAPRLWKQSPESKVALNEIVNSLRGIKDAALIIKVHHVDDNSFYHEFLSGSGYNAVVTKETDLYTLLYCSDLVISISSTVMLDALIMGKPVIQLNLLENYDFFEGLEGKVFEKVTDKKDLPEAVKRVLYNKKLFKKTEKQRKKFISEYYYKVDGKSTERFIGVMDGLLNRKE